MSTLYGLCPKCLEIKDLGKHHIHPRRFFKKQLKPPKFTICRECHDDLEYFIRERENGKKLSKDKYEDLLIQFLKG